MGRRSVGSVMVVCHKHKYEKFTVNAFNQLQLQFG